MPDVVKRRRLELFRCSTVTVAVGQAGPGETMLVKGVTHCRARRLTGARNKPGETAPHKRDRQGAAER
jgi:hypothetical protein